MGRRRFRESISALGAVAVLCLAVLPAAAAEAVRVFVDDDPLTLAPGPVVENGILYLPLRPLAQHFQAALSIDKQVIELRRTDGVVFALRLGRLEVWSGGVAVAVTEAPVRLINGTTMIPRGAVDVLFDTLTVWNRQDGIVNIVTQKATPVQTSTTAKPPAAARAVATAASGAAFEPEFRPADERPLLASGYVTVGLAFGSATTATGRVSFRTHTGPEQAEGTVALSAGTTGVAAAGTITLRRPGSLLVIGGLSVHDSPLTLHEQGLIGLLYQGRVLGQDARLFAGSLPNSDIHVYGMNVAFHPVGGFLLQGTMLHEPATGATVLKGRATRPLRPGLSAFAELAWGTSSLGSGSAYRVGLEAGSKTFIASISYLSLSPGFPTMGNANLFAGRSGPMVQLSYRPSAAWSFTGSAAFLRGSAGTPDRLVTSLLASYRPVPSIGIVAEMRSVEDTIAGVPSRSLATNVAVTFTRGRWGVVLASSQVSDANLLLGTEAATSTFSLRAGTTLANGLPIWAEVARSTGDTTSWSYALGWTFRPTRRLDLNAQLRHKVFSAPSTYSETSLEVGVSHPLASGAHLTLGGGLRYTSNTNSTTPYLAFQYGYPIYAYGEPQVGRLSAVMFADHNGNGVRDPDEPGVGGVVLRINDQTAAISDAQGAAAVSGIKAGDVTASLDDGTIPATLVAAQPSVTVRVAAKETTTVAFALMPAAVIRGVVFVDDNNNGVRDGEEKVVSGVVLRLLDSERFRTADLDGTFDFPSLPGGEYTVIVDQRTLPLGTRVRGEGRYTVRVRPGGSVTIEVALLNGKSIIRTFP